MQTLQNNSAVALWTSVSRNNNGRSNNLLCCKRLALWRKPYTKPLRSDADFQPPCVVSPKSYVPTQETEMARLLSNLEQGLCPLHLLEEDGDWPDHHFWAVVQWLLLSSRLPEVIQLFDRWKDIDKNRISEFYFGKVIGLYAAEGLLEDATWTFKQMKSYGLNVSVQIYNSMIHGYAVNGQFKEALFYLDQMKGENLIPDVDTYNGLIQAYGMHKMYDEMGKCFKRMKLRGCPPDYGTYNTILQEYAQAGLLTSMERAYAATITKRIPLQYKTLLAMVDAYARFGLVKKMEMILTRVFSYKESFITEDVVRKIATVYIDNCMFSRLSDLADDLIPRTGRTDLIWCLRLLSYACLMSRKGMNAIFREMEELNVSWNVTVANMVLLMDLKMKDFTHIRLLILDLTRTGVEFDLVTVGILVDAICIGFDGTASLKMLKSRGFLNRTARINTEPLVLTAFGKGRFLSRCEDLYSCLELKARENKKWTYLDLIRLVATNDGMKSILKGIE